MFGLTRRIMRNFSILAVLIVGLVAVVPVEAQAFSMIGAGVGSCGTWTADRRSRPMPADVDAEWVLGFLSGTGFEDGPEVNPLNGMDADGVLAWIDNYCHAHPITQIVDAAEAFRFEHPH
jgi:hypothetical protein